MAEFERVAPQVVQHRDGWRVQVADRFTVELVDGDRATKVAADLDGPVIRLHRGSLASAPVDADEVLSRIRAGFEAMNEQVEVVE